MTTTGLRGVVLLLGMLLGLLGVAALGAPAYAAQQDEAGGDFCADGVGVSVALDATALDGDVSRACVAADGEQSASQVLDAAGLDVTPVGPFPGAVCQVDGLPADVACAQMPSSNAYWGLFLAAEGSGTGDGSGDGAWDYAPVGVDELRLSPGDYVGFAWQTSAEPAPPGAEPVAGAATATTTSSSESAEPSPGGGVTVQSTPGTDAGEAADSGVSDGTPIWVFFVIVVVLAVAALVVVMVRNRRK